MKFVYLYVDRDESEKKNIRKKGYIFPVWGKKQTLNDDQRRERVEKTKKGVT